jgi:hypothetical protein
MAGTLDDPAAFKPTMDVYWRSVQIQPWAHTGGERTRFPKMPTWCPETLKNHRLRAGSLALGRS